MTTMTADDLADSISRGEKWKVIGCIGHDCEECQTRIAKDASHRSTTQEDYMNDLRTAAQQALEALEADNSKLWPSEKRTTAITALLAALAQEQDPEPVPHQHEWFRVGGWEPGRIRCIHCGKWGKETFDE